MARAGTGRPERSTASATAERPFPCCAPASGSQATPSRHTNLKMHPFRTSLGCGPASSALVPGLVRIHDPGLPFYLAVCGSCACRRLPRLQRSCSITRVPGANFRLDCRKIAKSWQKQQRCSQLHDPYPTCGRARIIDTSFRVGALAVARERVSGRTSWITCRVVTS